MKLTITKLISGLLLTWSVSERGTCYLMSSVDGKTYRVEAAFPVTEPVNAAVMVECDGEARMFKVEVRR